MDSSSQEIKANADYNTSKKTADLDLHLAQPQDSNTLPSKSETKIHFTQTPTATQALDQCSAAINKIELAESYLNKAKQLLFNQTVVNNQDHSQLITINTKDKDLLTDSYSSESKLNASLTEFYTKPIPFIKGNAINPTTDKR